MIFAMPSASLKGGRTAKQQASSFSANLRDPEGDNEPMKIAPLVLR
jgi:hypothetical protein